MAEDPGIGEVAMAEFSVEAIEAAKAVIHNFHVVNGDILRGSQPDQDGLEALRALQVRTIVNLRHHSRAPAHSANPTIKPRFDDLEIDEERVLAESLGMQFFNVSLDSRSAPLPGRIEQFVQICSQLENFPIFVHCQHGTDRTSAMIGAYRIKIDSWTVPAAVDEMCKYGFDPVRIEILRAIQELG